MASTPHLGNLDILCGTTAAYIRISRCGCIAPQFLRSCEMPLDPIVSSMQRPSKLMWKRSNWARSNYARDGVLRVVCRFSQMRGNAGNYRFPVRFDTSRLLLTVFLIWHTFLFTFWFSLHQANQVITDFQWSFRWMLRTDLHLRTLGGWMVIWLIAVMFEVQSRLSHSTPWH